MVSYRSVFITSLILIILLPIGFIWTVLEFRAIDKDKEYDLFYGVRKVNARR